MTDTFSATSTTDEVLAGIDLKGKRALVTGVSAGLGVETARALAAHGADVIGTARDLAKAERATAEVDAAAAAASGGFELVALDLASLASVRACADRLVADGRPIDIVIANAGVMVPPFGRTADGFETQFGVNHLGHFLLVNRIAPLIGRGGRLVTLTSARPRLADLDLADPSFAATAYDPGLAYGRSKTANILFAIAFDRRHRDRGVRACAVCPGGVRTELARHRSQADEDAMLAALDARRAAAGLPPFVHKTVSQGAATTVWAAAVADADLVGGQFCEDCRVVTMQPGGDGQAGFPSDVLDPERAEALWTASEALVGERFQRNDQGQRNQAA